MGLETDAKNLGYTEYELIFNELIFKLLVAKLTFMAVDSLNNDLWTVWPDFRGQDDFMFIWIVAALSKICIH